MLAMNRRGFFHYTRLRTKYLDSSRAIAAAQRLTTGKTSKKYRRSEFCSMAGEVGLASSFCALLDNE
jgi:hypothetical protein